MPKSDLSVFTDKYKPIYHSEIIKVSHSSPQTIDCLENINLKLIPGVTYGIFVHCVKGTLGCHCLTKATDYDRIVQDTTNLTTSKWIKRQRNGKNYQIVFTVA